MEPLYCELCEREVYKVTRHHLIPRTVHKNKWFKKNFSKEEMHTTVDLCRDCHVAIHRFIPEKEMGKHYHSLELLLSHPEVIKFVKWFESVINSLDSINPICSWCKTIRLCFFHRNLKPFRIRFLK